IDFHVAVTRLDECPFSGVCPHQRRFGMGLFDISGNRHDFVECGAVIKDERRQKAARVDREEIRLEIVPLRYVQLDALNVDALLRQEDADATWVWRYLAIV